MLTTTEAETTRHTREHTAAETQHHTTRKHTGRSRYLSFSTCKPTGSICLLYKCVDTISCLCTGYLNIAISCVSSDSVFFASSSARLATPEVVDRPCCNSVESAYWSGDFLKIFFMFDPSLTSGMSVVLMWGHCLRHRPHNKQHMPAGRVAHRKRLRHRPPHPTRHLREG